MLWISSLNYIDVNNDMMSMAISMVMFWTDTQLQWKPIECGGISEMSLDKKMSAAQADHSSQGTMAVKDLKRLQTDSQRRR